MIDQDFVPVYCPVDYLEADAIRQHLKNKSIPCHIEGEHQASLAGSGFFGNAGRWRMRLLVLAKDIERVRRIIHEHNWPKYT